MNCQEALSLLYDVIDKEASDIDTLQIEEHLKNCRDCSGVYKLESSVNELLQAKLLADNPTAQVDSLKAKVLMQLDDIDRENQPQDIRVEPSSGDPAPSFFRLGRTLAIAASVIVVATAVFFGMRVGDDHTAYLPLEQAHWSAESNPTGFVNAASTSLARDGMHQRLAYDISDVVKSFKLVGGQVEKIDGLEVAHFVYHNDDEVVSVFVIDAAMMTLPDDLMATLVNQNGIDFFDHNCRGCRLVYHRVGNALVITASANHEIDLLDFVPDRSPV